MLPLDPDILLLIKFFVFFTCVTFWVKLFVEAMMRNQWPHRRRHRRRHD